MCTSHYSCILKTLSSFKFQNFASGDMGYFQIRMRAHHIQNLLIALNFQIGQIFYHEMHFENKLGV